MKNDQITESCAEGRPVQCKCISLGERLENCSKQCTGHSKYVHAKRPIIYQLSLQITADDHPWDESTSMCIVCYLGKSTRNSIFCSILFRAAAIIDILYRLCLPSCHFLIKYWNQNHLPCQNHRKPTHHSPGNQTKRPTNIKIRYIIIQLKHKSITVHFIRIADQFDPMIIIHQCAGTIGGARTCTLHSAHVCDTKNTIANKSRWLMKATRIAHSVNMILCPKKIYRTFQISTWS